MIVNTHYGSFCVPPDSYLAEALHAESVYEDVEVQLALRLVGEGDWFVDVGAHAGWYSKIMAEHGAYVTAIEPNPRFWPYLSENLKDYLDRAAIIPYAAFEANGVAEFYLPSDYNDGWGSLAAPDAESAGEKIPVELRRLDSLLWVDNRIKLLKLDVEGVEAQVLRGLGQKLSSVDYILVECVDRLERLLKFGSSVSWIKAILHGWELLRVTPQNYLFTNPEIVQERKRAEEMARRLKAEADAEPVKAPDAGVAP